jgi:hypothetical protein
MEGIMASGYIFINIEPGNNQQIVSALRETDGIRHAHVCWGLPDIVAFAEADSYESLANIGLVEVQKIPSIRSAEVHIVVPW